MKRAFSLCTAALMLTLALPVSALAAETAGGLLSNLGDPERGWYGAEEDL